MVIGITGGIGSGKTFISRMFNSSEVFVVFNSDLCAKQILVENSEVIDFVKNKIGEKSYNDGIIQTKYISDVIFNDKRKLNELNKILHPKVLHKFEKFKSSNLNKIIIIESAILFETGIYLQTNYNILVKAPIKERINRVVFRDKISKLVNMRNFFPACDFCDGRPLDPTTAEVYDGKGFIKAAEQAVNPITFKKY